VDKEEKVETSPVTGNDKPKKGLSGKKKRILAVMVVLIIVAVAIVVGLWGNTPVPYMTVSNVTYDSSEYLNEEIEIKALVEDWDSTGKTFNLTDEESSLVVSYVTLPDGFNNGKEIVVKGILRDDGGLILEATEIIVGCPSKY
jgi:cytochrome c-type biogenesis protein CcmE